MRCPFCDYLRKKSDCNPHWQCPKCERAYNKVQSKSLDQNAKLDGYTSKKHKTQDFIAHSIVNLKAILKITLSIILLFWGVDEFLIEGTYYTANYYQYLQSFLGTDLFIFCGLILFLLLIIAAVLVVGRKVVGKD